MCMCIYIHTYTYMHTYIHTPICSFSDAASPSPFQESLSAALLRVEVATVDGFQVRTAV